MISIHKLIFFIFFGTCILGLNQNQKNQKIEKYQTTTPIDYELLAENIVREANDHFLRYLEILRDHSFTPQYKLYRQHKILSKDEAITQYRHQLIVTAEQLRKIPYHDFKNIELQRQVKLLSNIQIMGLNDNDYRKAKYFLGSMKDYGIRETICDYTDQNICNVTHAKGIDRRYRVTRTIEEMNYLWTEWRERVGRKAREEFQQYINLYRKAALLNGHITPSLTWYMYYEDDNLLKEITNAINDIMPFYKELHAYIRHTLRLTYDHTSIDEDGPIPQPLFAQAIMHAWSNNSKFIPPYSNRKLPDIQENMRLQALNSLKIVNMAENFFQTMGLKPLSRDFWDNFVRIIPDKDAGHDCKAEVYNLVPDVALRYCQNYTFRSFLQMHGVMSSVEYLVHRNTLPIGLNRDPCPGFQEALGESVIISASSPKHLEALGFIENYTIDEELNINRLLRFAVHTFFSLMSHFANEKFWVDSLNHVIPSERYNCEYWKIQDQYVGVEPPSARSESNFDPEYKFYQGLDDEKPTTIKIISELMGYQIYKALCLRSKQFQPNHPDHPLYNCDFYNDYEVGTLLHELMQRGSKGTWREALYFLTGETKISAGPILEYYEPLRKWLKSYNSRHNVHVGWEPSEKCDN